MSSGTFAVRYRNFKGSVTTMHKRGSDPEKCADMVKDKGRFVIGVKKVGPEDVMGDLLSFPWIKENFVYSNKKMCLVPKYPQAINVKGIINDETTIDSIVFSSKSNVSKPVIKVDGKKWYNKLVSKNKEEGV